MKERDKGGGGVGGEGEEEAEEEEEERGKEKKRREEYCMTNALHRLMYPFESGFLTSCLELNTM